ncbi:hypothetical protein CY35_19G002000 [Sphagnum magellanicum]|nr:hypothetical protein CY35_19G002000 [Sphagnum magellanicum]
MFAWNTKLKKYVKGGQPEKAMQFFQQLQQEGMNPGKFNFNHMIKACAGLRWGVEGKFVHEQIIESGWNSNVLAGSSLIDMYVKCASMEDAQRVFKKMPS